MIATTNGINRKEIKITSHDEGGNISKLVDVIYCTSLGQSIGHSFEDSIEPRRSVCMGVDVHQLQKIDCLYSFTAVINCFIDSGDIGVADAIGC